MPCSDSRDHGPSPEELRRQQIATHLACLYCKHLDATGEAIPEFAVEWWRDHKREDARREAQEKRDAVRMQARRRALKRLTPEEIEALGLLAP